jgi:hypothetical protein
MNIKLFLFSLFCLASSFCSAQSAEYEVSKITQLLSKYMDTSTYFSSQFKAFFRTKSKSSYFFCWNDSAFITEENRGLLNLNKLDKSVFLKRRNKKAFYGHLVSLKNESYSLEIYAIPLLQTRYLPTLFCEFKLNFNLNKDENILENITIESKIVM